MSKAKKNKEIETTTPAQLPTSNVLNAAVV